MEIETQPQTPAHQALNLTNKIQFSSEIIPSSSFLDGRMILLSKSENKIWEYQPGTASIIGKDSNMQINEVNQIFYLKNSAENFGFFLTKKKFFMLKYPEFDYKANEDDFEFEECESDPWINSFIDGGNLFFLTCKQSYSPNGPGDTWGYITVYPLKDTRNSSIKYIKNFIPFKKSEEILGFLIAENDNQISIFSFNASKILTSVTTTLDKSSSIIVKQDPNNHDNFILTGKDKETGDFMVQVYTYSHSQKKLELNSTAILEDNKTRISAVQSLEISKNSVFIGTEFSNQTYFIQIMNRDNLTYVVANVTNSSRSKAPEYLISSSGKLSSFTGKLSSFTGNEILIYKLCSDETCLSCGDQDDKCDVCRTPANRGFYFIDNFCYHISLQELCIENYDYELCKDSSVTQLTFEKSRRSLVEKKDKIINIQVELREFYESIQLLNENKFEEIITVEIDTTEKSTNRRRLLSKKVKNLNLMNDERILEEEKKYTIKYSSMAGNLILMRMSLDKEDYKGVKDVRVKITIDHSSLIFNGTEFLITKAEFDQRIEFTKESELSEAIAGALKDAEKFVNSTGGAVTTSSGIAAVLFGMISLQFMGLALKFFQTMDNIGNYEMINVPYGQMIKGIFELVESFNDPPEFNEETWLKKEDNFTNFQVFPGTRSKATDSFGEGFIEHTSPSFILYLFNWVFFFSIYGLVRIIRYFVGKRSPKYKKKEKKFLYFFFSIRTFVVGYFLFDVWPAALYQMTNFNYKHKHPRRDRSGVGIIYWISSRAYVPEMPSEEELQKLKTDYMKKMRVIETINGILKQKENDMKEIGEMSEESIIDSNFIPELDMISVDPWNNPFGEMNDEVFETNHKLENYLVDQFGPKDQDEENVDDLEGEMEEKANRQAEQKEDDLDGEMDEKVNGDVEKNLKWSASGKAEGNKVNRTPLGKVNLNPGNEATKKVKISKDSTNEELSNENKKKNGKPKEILKKKNGKPKEILKKKKSEKLAGNSKEEERPLSLSDPESDSEDIELRIKRFKKLLDEEEMPAIYILGIKVTAENEHQFLNEEQITKRREREKKEKMVMENMRRDYERRKQIERDVKRLKRALARFLVFKSKKTVVQKKKIKKLFNNQISIFGAKQQNLPKDVKKKIMGDVPPDEKERPEERNELLENDVTKQEGEGVNFRSRTRERVTSAFTSRLNSEENSLQLNLRRTRPVAISDFNEDRLINPAPRQPIRGSNNRTRQQNLGRFEGRAISGLNSRVNSGGNSLNNSRFNSALNSRLNSHLNSRLNNRLNSEANSIMSSRNGIINRTNHRGNNRDNNRDNDRDNDRDNNRDNDRAHSRVHSRAHSGAHSRASSHKSRIVSISARSKKESTRSMKNSLTIEERIREELKKDTSVFFMGHKYIIDRYMLEFVTSDILVENINIPFVKYYYLIFVVRYLLIQTIVITLQGFGLLQCISLFLIQGGFIAKAINVQKKHGLYENKFVKYKTLIEEISVLVFFGVSLIISIAGFQNVDKTDDDGYNGYTSDSIGGNFGFAIEFIGILSIIVAFLTETIAMIIIIVGVLIFLFKYFKKKWWRICCFCCCCCFEMKQEPKKKGPGVEVEEIDEEKEIEKKIYERLALLMEKEKRQRKKENLSKMKRLGLLAGKFGKRLPPVLNMNPSKSVSELGR